MAQIVPDERPALTREAASEWLGDAHVGVPAILGRRGYYRDLLGVRGQNDRNLYDDAIAVVSPRAFATFNANTDPSASGGRLAVLQPGVYHYKPGIHHPGTPKAYPCLVQDGDVTVLRDNGVRESGEFYIHIHKGGFLATSSAGCQTIYPLQWTEFYDLVIAEMRYYGVHSIPYVLTERESMPRAA